MSLSLIDVYDSIQRVVVYCHILLPAKSDRPSLLHVVHLSETFEYLQWSQVIFVVGGFCIRETFLVLLDIAEEEKFVQVSLILEMQIAETGSDRQTGIFHFYCSLNVRFPHFF